MKFETIKENGFEYIEIGEGPVVVLLHGLMGGLDNFEGIIEDLPNHGFKVVGPLLPLFEKPFEACLLSQHKLNMLTLANCKWRVSIKTYPSRDLFVYTLQLQTLYGRISIRSTL